MTADHGLETHSTATSSAMPWLRPLWLQLVSGYQQQRLPHALAFPDAPEVGSELLRAKLQQFLLCDARLQRQQACGECKSCKLYLAGNHPDFIEVAAEDGKQLGIDAIRQAMTQVQKTAGQGGNKVITIMAVDHMTVQAANALLKTLEEPPNNTYFCLFATQYSQVLATIRSRSTFYPLPLPSREQRLAWQAEQDEVSASIQLGFADIVRGEFPKETDATLLQMWFESILSELHGLYIASLSADFTAEQQAVLPKQLAVSDAAAIFAAAYRRGIEIRALAKQSGLNLSLLLQAWCSELIVQLYRKRDIVQD